MTIQVKARQIAWKSVVEKSVSTFIQSFLSIFVIADMSSAKGAFTAAGAATLSVLKNAVKDWNEKVSA